MVFGKRLWPAQNNSISRDRFVALIMSVFVGLMLMLALGGCGSGSGDGGNNNNNNNNGNNGGSTAIITGRVIDQNNNSAAVPGASVRYGSSSAVTDNNGNFTFTVSAAQSNLNLLVIGPALADGTAGFYNTGVVGSQQYSIATAGYPVPAIPAGTTLNLGTIILYSQSGPPPPPIF